jgi:DoxX-like protein
MQPEFTGVSKGTLWAARIISGLVALFLLLDGGMKLVKPAFVVEETMRLGYRESVIFPLGVVLIVCTILYLIPRTAVFGAILLTAYLGGAVATHVRAGEPVSSVVFAIVFAVLVWLGLYLRNPTLRLLVPLSSI